MKKQKDIKILKCEEEIPPTPEQLEEIQLMNEALLKGTDFFRLQLREIAIRKGGIAELAKKSGIRRENLYRMLSNTGKTSTGSIFKIMNALGYRFTIMRKNNENEVV